ncbi:MAG: DUF642 domain-containing protein [Acidimicrobiales bacterium]|jgi:hypothetical protein
MRGFVLTGLVAVGLIPAMGTSYGTTISGNIVTNGGFELPVVATGSYQVFSVGQHFSGWRVVGAPGNVAVISGAFQQSGLTFLAKAGKQWLDLTGVSNTSTGVAQTVRTVRGSNYRLTFSVGNVYDPAGIFGVSSTVEVLVNGVKVLTATNAHHGGKVQVWENFGLTVRAKSSSTTVEFLNGDPPSDNSNGLDAISMVRTK